MKGALVSIDEINNVTIIEFHHSILVVNGSPSPEACERFIKILTMMKAKQRSDIQSMSEM